MVGWLAIAAAFIAAQRLAELRLAARNRRWLLARGAREYGREHYLLFVILHAAWLAGWVAEGLIRGGPGWGWPMWAGLFCAAQVLRYWCIASLGCFWNTRVFAVPGAPLVRSGPYRFLRHPNYVAVAVELACMPLIFGAWVTAAAASVLNAWLLLAVRIPAEKAALDEAME